MAARAGGMTGSLSKVDNFTANRLPFTDEKSQPEKRGRWCRECLKILKVMRLWKYAKTSQVWMLRLSCPAFRAIMGRRIESRKIFLKGRDRKNFLGRLSAMAQEGALDIYA
jgi:hypothetical protein